MTEEDDKVSSARRLGAQLISDAEREVWLQVYIAALQSAWASPRMEKIRFEERVIPPEESAKRAALAAVQSFRKTFAK